MSVEARIKTFEESDKLMPQWVDSTSTAFPSPDVFRGIADVCSMGEMWGKDMDMRKHLSITTQWQTTFVRFRIKLDNMVRLLASCHEVFHFRNTFLVAGNHQQIPIGYAFLPPGS